ncbi:cation-transporting P-type ATPase [Rhodococcus sp. H29-C3]|uniref:cation-transporting P-type ATPase n=1 Tax=Rhodococcus sp. H29-C3 TaxID=3046307 RepID=UPI0024B96DB6|nr:cation-transporting P-type ATPase [Rhodococcus sp. H29-C3]MDJ0360661.1 cation-transporting P-type ATPase [Rhodococcus sp. H29-C3]
MTLTATRQATTTPMGIVSAAAMSTADLMEQLAGSAEVGLSGVEAARRRAQWGPNAVSSHRARFWPVLWHQLRSPLLALLLIAATASYFVGERSSALIIGIIVALSVGLGFVNDRLRNGRVSIATSFVRRRSLQLHGKTQLWLQRIGGWVHRRRPRQHRLV